MIDVDNFTPATGSAEGDGDQDAVEHGHSGARESANLESHKIISGSRFALRAPAE
jgi:hypothetical protein